MEWLSLAMHHPDNEPSLYSDYFTEQIELGDDTSIIARVRHAAKIIYSFEAENKVKKLVKKFRPDIIHAHNIYHHLSPSVLKAGKDCGVPVVLTTHDLKLLCPAYSMTSHGRVRTAGCRAVARCCGIAA
ncbi:MAG: glycosyltransferase [Pseudomonadales bacterium]